MSRLTDYSKFDHIDSDDENETDTHPSRNNSEGVPIGKEKGWKGITKVGSEQGRYVFEMNGRKIYEWEQSLEEVTIYVETPPGKKASELIVNIFNNRLQVGLKNHDRFFIDELTYSKVNTTESSWYMESNTLHIILMKVHRGETWEGALKGADRASSVDPFTKEQMKEQLMIERFQEENPGFDFRDAKFNGQIPDPRTFMGGVKYS